MSLIDLFRNARHNRNLYKSGQADRSQVHKTTVGWRPDPINREDGFQSDFGNDCITGIDPVTGHYTYNTPSGNREYYRVVRGKGPAYGPDPDEWSETYDQWKARRKREGRR